ncbi:MAG: hypothetical protein ACRDOH_06905 [Streptosporangiaceae bacterium]
MSGHLELQLGARPWRPTDDTRLVTELDYYDIPTAGVLEQRGSPVLFMCVDGHGTNATVWVYAPLQAEEAEALSTMQGGEVIDAEMRRIFRSKPVVVALAVDGQLRLATSGQLRLQGAVLRDAALEAVTKQADSDQQAVCSLLTHA